MSMPAPKQINALPTPRLKAGSARLLFVDNLRLVTIALVVLVHLNVTYGQIGSWYYVEQRSLDTISTVLFAAFGSFTQAYFMGVLFFLAGYFVPGAYDKKGPKRFTAERLLRLGVPTVVYMFLLNPIIGLIRSGYMGQTPDHLDRAYWSYLTSLEFLQGSGPLWFALALLVFSMIYIVVRLAAPQTQRLNLPPQRVTNASLVGCIVCLSAVTFLVRLVQPIGTAFYNMQLCFFPQYVVLFVLGLAACRSDLLNQLPNHTGGTWLKMALFAGVPLWVATLLLGGALNNIEPYYGGWHWQALAYALWESFFCISFSLGILVWFRTRCNAQNRFLAFLSANAFGVYVFHAPILVGVTMAMRDMVLHPMLKMGLAALIVFPLCFGFSGVVRVVPAFRKLFS